MLSENDELPEERGDSEVVGELKRLTKGTGVRRRNLYGVLGENLRRAWGIRATMRPQEVRRKVIDEVSKLIATTDDEQETRIMRVYFNLPLEVDSQSELENSGLKKRIDWLADNERGSKYAVSQSTSNRTRARAFSRYEAIVGERLAEFDAAGFVAPVAPFYRRPLVLGAVVTALVVGASLGTYGVLHSATPTPPKLNATLGKIKDGTAGWRIAFPSDKLAEAAPFLKAGPDPLAAGNSPEGPTFAVNELNHGGYLVGGAVIIVNLDTTSSRELTVDNVELVNVVHQSTVTGALVSIGGQGDETFQMQFDIQQPDPIPRIIPSAGDNVGPDDPFFDVKHIGVSATNSQALAMYIPDGYGAYTFDIKIDYELDGHHYSLTMTRDGQPFRITSDICPEEGLALEDTSAQLAELKSMRYQQITGRDIDPNSGLPAMIASDPSSYVASYCHY